MKLERYTHKAWGTYPRCQHVDGDKQCTKTVYADDVCWTHYAPKVPPRPVSSNDGSKSP